MNIDTDPNWTMTENELPPEGVIVKAMDGSGRVQELRREGNIWFNPDFGMYVYYVPAYWKLA